MKIFRVVVAQDNHQVDTADITHSPSSRYYLDLAQALYDVNDDRYFELSDVGKMLY